MAELMNGGAGHDPRWRGGSAFWLELPGGGGPGQADATRGQPPEVSLLKTL
jgi:hypothetical protein